MPTLMCHQTATSRLSPQFGCACVDPVHQSPLAGFHAPDMVARRLADGWTTPACPVCGHHGWLPPVKVTT